MIADAGNWSSFVVSQIWQIGLLGLVVTVVNKAVGRRWPHLAYALWLVVLAKCFIPPLGPSGLLAHTAPAMWLNAKSISTSADASSKPSAQAGLNSDDSTRTETANNADSAIRVRADDQIGRLFAIAWLVGSVLWLGIAIGRGVEINRRLRRTSRPAPADVMAIVERLVERIKLRQGVDVLVAGSDCGPLVTGLRRSRLYIPAALLQRLTTAELEAMLTHELAHIRRRDTWVAGLQFVAQIVWWFHPVVWWMNRELTRHRERCCDEEVVANLNGERRDYARCLVHVLEARQTLEPLWGYPAVRPAELTRQRLEEIMKRENMNHRRAPVWCSLAAAAVAIVALPGARAEIAAQQPAEKSATAAPATAATQAASPARSATTKQPNTLSYDDGEADGKKSLGGSGEVIRFELPQGVDAVAGIRIHGSRYGLPQAPKEDFEIIFMNENFDEVLHTEKAPYELFRRGNELWVRINFKTPVVLPKKFWVVLDFHAEQTKGVYVSYDTSTKGQYSRVGLPGEKKKPQETNFGGDWMIQLLLKPPAAASATDASKGPPAIPANR